VVRGVIQDEEDKETEMWCIDSNRTEEDILCRKELDELVQQAAGRFHLYHTLSKPSPDWQGLKGRMSKSMFEGRLPDPSKGALVMVCGPDPLVNHTVKPILTELGWDVESQLVVF
jgi:nitrate reductase (NAD(P)H)